MKRSAAILMTLLTPGVVFLALAMGCIFMSHGKCETHECCEGLTTVSAPCCNFQAGQSGPSLTASQFTLAAPDASVTVAPVSAAAGYTTAAIHSTPLDSSPPVLTLRL